VVRTTKFAWVNPRLRDDPLPSRRVDRLLIAVHRLPTAKETFMRARSPIGILLLLVSITASAGTNAVPEPGSLELLAIAIAAGVAVVIRKRRK